MPSADSIAALNQGQANDLYRETAQIFFAIKRDLPKNKEEAKQWAKKGYEITKTVASPLADRIANPKHRYGIPSNTTPEAHQTQKLASRNPNVLASKLVDINKSMGTKGKDGVTRFKGANFDLATRGKGNVTLKDKATGETLLKISNNRVRVNKTTPKMAATIHKSAAKVKSQGMGK